MRTQKGIVRVAGGGPQEAGGAAAGDSRGPARRVPSGERRAACIARTGQQDHGGSVAVRAPSASRVQVAGSPRAAQRSWRCYQYSRAPRQSSPLLDPPNQGGLSGRAQPTAPVQVHLQVVDPRLRGYACALVALVPWRRARSLRE